MGFTLPKFIDLGPSLVYSVGVNLSFSGSTTVDFGVNTTVPDSAQILVDYSNRGASKATGFGESKMVPSYNINNESVSVTLSAFSQPAIDFGVNLYELGNLDVNVAIMLPEVSTTVGAKYGKHALPYT